MNNDSLIRSDIGLPFLLGWYKEVDRWEFYTALPKGLIMWDMFDHEIHNEDIS
tara:strand:- start:412 stop:570 length:159 start_codon:yes stop_codon:yes gene_type:complete